MNEPIGRFGSCSPARARRTAFATACDGLVLADHALVQPLLHVEQLLALALEHPCDRDARPLRDDLGDLLGVDFLRQQRALLRDLDALAELRLALGRASPYRISRDALEIARALGALGLAAQLSIARLTSLIARRIAPSRAASASGRARRGLPRLGELALEPARACGLVVSFSSACARSRAGACRVRPRRARSASSRSPCAAARPPRRSGRSPCPAGSGR